MLMRCIIKDRQMLIKDRNIERKRLIAFIAAILSSLLSFYLLYPDFWFFRGPQRDGFLWEQLPSFVIALLVLTASFSISFLWYSVRLRLAADLDTNNIHVLINHIWGRKSAVHTFADVVEIKVSSRDHNKPRSFLEFLLSLGNENYGEDVWYRCTLRFADGDVLTLAERKDYLPVKMLARQISDFFQVGNPSMRLIDNAK